MKECEEADWAGYMSIAIEAATTKVASPWLLELFPFTGRVKAFLGGGHAG